MASYPIPAWLQPQGDPGELYLQAQQQGATVQLARERLATEQQQALMENQTRQDIAAQRAREQEQQFAVDQARISALASLHDRELENQQQRIQQTGQIAADKLAAKARDAANQFAAQQSMSRRIAAGENPASVALTTPGLALPGSGIASLAKAVAPVPNALVEPQTRTFTLADGTQIPYLLEKSGVVRFPPKIASDELTTAARDRLTLQHLNAQRKDMATELKDPTSGRNYIGMTDEQITKAKKDAGANDRAIQAAIARRKNAEALQSKIDTLDAQIESILAGKKTATATATPTKGARVSVINPAGKKGTISADQLDEALKEGYTQVDDDSD